MVKPYTTVLDLDHATLARECAIDIPGPETRGMGETAREYDYYVMTPTQAPVTPEIPGRFFNIGSLWISPARASCGTIKSRTRREVLWAMNG
ncbi:MAG TPA: hypothetical protein VHU91_05020 [Mycobacteriales bacterium]|jgi:hypothetical protein|nr:hypothetical protein [Mycobacteriales bacterium]